MEQIKYLTHLAHTSAVMQKLTLVILISLIKIMQIMISSNYKKIFQKHEGKHWDKHLFVRQSF